MSWVDGEVDPQTLAQQLQGRPQLRGLYEKYQAFCESLWNAERVPHRVLEICRLRLAAIHDCQEQWQLRRPEVVLSDAALQALQSGTNAPFDAIEQQALAVAECIPHAHHDISDVQVESLRGQLGNDGCVALLTALAFFDVNARLSMTLGASAAAGHQ